MSSVSCTKLGISFAELLIFVCFLDAISSNTKQPSVAKMKNIRKTIINAQSVLHTKKVLWYQKSNLSMLSIEKAQKLDRFAGNPGQKIQLISGPA